MKCIFRALTASEGLMKKTETGANIEMWTSNDGLFVLRPKRETNIASAAVGQVQDMPSTDVQTFEFEGTVQNKDGQTIIRPVAFEEASMPKLNRTSRSLGCQICCSF